MQPLGRPLEVLPGSELLFRWTPPPSNRDSNSNSNSNNNSNSNSNSYSNSISRDTGEMEEKMEATFEGLRLRWTPHPVIVTIGDNKGSIRVLVYSY